MSSLSGLVKQLSRERDHVQRKLSALNAALIAVAYRNGTATTRRKLSAKGRTRIVAAQRARWKKQASSVGLSNRSIEAKRDFHADLDIHGLSVLLCWLEAPPLDRFDGFRVQSRSESPNHANVARMSFRVNDQS